MYIVAVNDGAVMNAWKKQQSAGHSDAPPVVLKKRSECAAAVSTASSSDAPPARIKAKAKAAAGASRAASSDAPPARSTPRSRQHDPVVIDAESDAHPRRITLQARTPLWDNFVDKMDLICTWYGRQLMGFIEEHCFFGDLCYKNSNGDDLDTPLPLPTKMEALLEKATEVRHYILEKVAYREGYPVEDTTYEIEEEDMRTMWQRRLHERVMPSMCSDGD